MKSEGEGYLLRICIGEQDKWHHQPLYEAIVLKARELGLSGATVLRGPMGFGARSRLHTAKILRLSEDLPVLIEIVDTEGAHQFVDPRTGSDGWRWTHHTRKGSNYKVPWKEFLNVIRRGQWRPAAVCFARGHQGLPMCRNIRTLFNFEPPATEDEIRASALQFVRKISGFTKPSQANETLFARAVEDVSLVARSLIDSLVTSAPPRDRETESAKARARAAKRYSGSRP